MSDKGFSFFIRDKLEDICQKEYIEFKSTNLVLDIITFTSLGDEVKALQSLRSSQKVLQRCFWSKSKAQEMLFEIWRACFIYAKIDLDHYGGSNCFLYHEVFDEIHTTIVSNNLHLHTNSSALKNYLDDVKKNMRNLSESINNRLKDRHIKFV